MKMKFSEVFKIEKKDVVCVTGGGGKTSLIFKLAEELKNKGKVLVTTTTKMSIPKSSQYQKLILDDRVLKGEEKGVNILGKELDKERDKLIGIEDITLERELKKYDYILIESDGSRGKPIKIWKENDPVISKYVTKIVGVTNIKGIGKKVSQVVHRANPKCDEIFTVKKMESYIKNGDFFKSPIKLKRDIKKYIFINGVENRKDFKNSFKISNSLYENLDFQIVLGSVVENKIYRYKKISAVVLASGNSKRMGVDKTLLRYRGKTLLETLLDKVEKIGFYEKNLIITKKRYMKVEKELKKYRDLKIIFNENSEKGQSESVKLGVKNSEQTQGYMFLPVDQPFLREETIYRLIEKFLLEQEITVPTVGNKRFSPVIFPDTYKEDLLKLEGDTGGREIIKNSLVVKAIFSHEEEFKDIDNPEDVSILKWRY